MFHVSSKILNYPSEKIMFLRNFCHLFPVFFMIEIQVLMTVPDFSGVFSKNHFLEGASLFNGGRFVFQFGRLHF